MAENYLAPLGCVPVTFEGSKFSLVGREPQMTIIASLKEGEDSLLIAADSALTEPQIGYRSLCTNKLQRHSQAPLAWGISGNPTIGIDRFGPWLREYSWPPSDLRTFQDEVACKLSEFNGKQREICKLAGIEAKPDDLATVLVAGLLNVPFIFEVDERGVLSNLPEGQNFHAIGSGAAHAKLIYLAFTAVTIQAQAAERLRVIMELAASAATMCDPPIHIWRVTRNGAEEVTPQPART
jgi:hypothetical protein